MLKTKILITTVILIFLIVTSIIKNQTRIIEKKIHKLHKLITLKEKDINESQLDFYFLSSPSVIDKKVIILGKNNYQPIKNSNIFLSFSDFTNIQKKISELNKHNEKKTKKN